MALEDQFRKNAERCRLMAEASINTSDRAFWLLLAENWQTMAQDREAEQPDERDQVQPASSH